MIEMRLATASDAPALEQLAKEIWTEHYAPLIGRAQVDYMLERFQSHTAIAGAIAADTRYYLALEKGEPIAYMALKPEAAHLFLSKLYVRKDQRGKGVAHGFMKTAAGWAKELGLPCIRLTVNKQNSGSIAAYEKMGFSVVCEVVADIGGGYVMDDYIMELPIG